MHQNMSLTNVLHIITYLKCQIIYIFLQLLAKLHLKITCVLLIKIGDVHETAIHRMTVEFNLIQVPLRPSTMNQNPYHNGSCKRPEKQNVIYS